MKSPPFFRTLLLVLFVLGAVLVSLLPEQTWHADTPSASEPSEVARRVPEAPAPPPQVMGSASCRGFDTSGRWFPAALYVGSYDDGDTYSTTCFFADQRIRVRVANINTADD